MILAGGASVISRFHPIIQVEVTKTPSTLPHGYSRFSVAGGINNIFIPAERHDALVRRTSRNGLASSINLLHRIRIGSTSRNAAPHARHVIRFFGLNLEDLSVNHDKVLAWPIDADLNPYTALQKYWSQRCRRPLARPSLYQLLRLAHALARGSLFPPAARNFRLFDDLEYVRNRGGTKVVWTMQSFHSYDALHPALDAAFGAVLFPVSMRSSASALSAYLSRLSVSTRFTMSLPPSFLTATVATSIPRTPAMLLNLSAFPQQLKSFCSSAPFVPIKMLLIWSARSAKFSARTFSFISSREPISHALPLTSPTKRPSTGASS